MSKRWRILALLFLSTLVGCGDSGPLRHPVEGVLRIDGEPLPFKSLTFLPIEGTEGHGAAGFSDEDGNYKLQAMVPGALRDYPGCPPGRYRVAIGEPMIPLDSPQPQGDADDEAPVVILGTPAGSRRKKRKGNIPNLYRWEATTPLIVEVGEGFDNFDLELSSKPQSLAASAR